LLAQDSSSFAAAIFITTGLRDGERSRKSGRLPRLSRLGFPARSRLEALDVSAICAIPLMGKVTTTNLSSPANSSTWILVIGVETRAVFMPAMERSSYVALCWANGPKRQRADYICRRWKLISKKDKPYQRWGRDPAEVFEALLLYAGSHTQMVQHGALDRGAQMVEPRCVASSAEAGHDRDRQMQ
jgi:hypothetical protein